MLIVYSAGVVMVIEYFLEWVQTAPVSKRVDAAGALVRAYLRNDVSSEEREDIEAAITTLTEDAAPSVRYEIAQSFGAHASAPRHIISVLANDSLDISILVLSQSPVFHDAELAGFAVNGASKQQIAVACRPWVSEKLANSICEGACRDAAYAILVNPAANLVVPHLHQLANRFGADTEIRNLLNDRDDLSAQSRLLLIEKLGASLGGLATKFAWLLPERSEQVIAESCDRASIIFAARSTEDDVRQIVRDRISENRLTVAYLLRAVCMGNITLAAHAFSELSGVNFARVETVLTKNRQSAFRAIYDRAGLPGSAFDVFQTAITTWRELLESRSAINQSRLPFLVTKEVLASCSIGQGDVVDELLVLLRKLSAEAARESAKSKAVEIANREVADEVLETEAIAIDDVSEGEVPLELIEEEFQETLDRELEEMEALLLEEADEVDFPTEQALSHSTLTTADVGYLGNLNDDHLHEMYADIYDMPGAEGVSLAEAA